MYAELSNYYDPPLWRMTHASVVRFEKPSFSDLDLVAWDLTYKSILIWRLLTESVRLFIFFRLVDIQFHQLHCCFLDYSKYFLKLELVEIFER